MPSTSPLFVVQPGHRALGLTLLRIIVGITFAAHGYQKLFIYGIAGIRDGFTKMGVPMPMVTAPLVSGLEFFGGLALIIGLLTRLVALGLVIDMLGAIFLVHLANGFFLPTGYEFPLLLLVASLALVFGGAGSFSVDDAIARRASLS